MLNRNRGAISRRILIPAIIIIIVQALLYAVFTWQGSVFDDLQANSLDILSERTINRESYLQNDMLHKWANTRTTESAVISLTEKILKEKNATYDDMRTDFALNSEIVESAAPAIIDMLRKNSVTGSFLILNGKGTPTGNYAGFYVRDFDPSGFSEDNGDLAVVRGLPSLTKKLQLSLDSFWKSSFAFSNPQDPQSMFFFKPFITAKANKPESSTDYGYWSPLFRLDGEGSKIITYSVPLIANDGTVFGVLGVDISERIFLDMLDYKELCGIESSAYMLGITATDGKVDKFVSNGPYFLQAFGVRDNIRLTEKAHNIVYTTDSADSNSVYIACAPLSLYNSTSPFAGDEWVLLGIANRDTLMSVSDKLLGSIVTASLIAMFVGLVVMVFTAQTITRPITRLFVALEGSDPSKPICLPKTGLREIDTLSHSIEELSTAVSDSASRFSKIIEMTDTQLGVFEYLDDSSAVFCSKSMYKLLGWTDGDGNDAYIPIDEFFSRMRVAFPDCRGTGCITCVTVDDRLKWLKLVRFTDGNRHSGAVSDITVDVLEKQRIEYERDYDGLTCLLNRRAFTVALENLLRHPEKIKVGALVMWDIDNLKYINDTYGHDIGDRSIVVLSEFLKTLSSEKGIVGRRSGDEFYAFLYGYDTKDEITQMLHSIEALIDSCQIDLFNGEIYKIRASGGVSWYPEDSRDMDLLVHYADFAMYSAKRMDKGHILEFEKESYKQNGFFIKGQGALDNLIEKKLVLFALQPIWSVNEARVFGYEMLMRPQTPELTRPFDVLRLARVQGRMGDIEHLTMFEGLRIFAEKQKHSSLMRGDEYVFLNSIANQRLMDDDLDSFKQDFAPYLSRLVLEITEGDPLDNVYTKYKAEEIRSMGGLVAIDDYGSGYNGEGILISLTPDIVKIDMNIIRGIDIDPNRQHIFENLSSYARTRNIKILAEGIETMQELAFVVSHGVDYLQGNLIGEAAFEPTLISQSIISAINTMAKK